MQEVQTNIDQKIIEKCETLFMKYGIKSVSMDDIANSIGISKKTIYQYFENKNDLINKVVIAHITKEKEKIEEILASATDAIEEIVLIARHILVMLKQTKPTAIFDLKKYYGDSWKLLESLHLTFIEQVINNNLLKGIKDGLYRKNLDARIISKLYVGKSLLIADDEMFPDSEFAREKLYREFINYHIHGISTDKGLLRLKDLKEKNNEN